MSKDSIQLVGGPRMATELQSHGSAALAHFQHVIATEVGAVPRLVPRYLTATGGASVEMNVNGSVTPATFDLTPGSDKVWRVSRLSLLLIATAAPTWPLFGNLAALTNGILLEVRNAAGQITDLTAGQPWKTNRDMAISWWAGIEDTVVAAEWRFAVPLRIEGGLGEFLRMSVRDDLSALTRLRVLADCLEETELT